LGGRLHLHQELAADAAAAPLVGGSGPYLRALARLALRQDDRPLCGPVSALLSGTGTLTRRIQMLQVEDGLRERKPARLGRLALVGLLAATAVGLSALRSPAQKTEAEGRPEAAGADDPTQERYFAGGFRSLRGMEIRDAGLTGSVVLNERNFDISYVPEDAMGVFACRPGAVLKRPALKKLGDAADEQLAGLMKQIKVPTDHLLPIADIEQVVGTIRIQTDPTRKEGQSAMFMDLTMIRAAKKFDWTRLLHDLVPDVVEVKHAGKVYFKIPKSKSERDALVVQFLGDKICYHMPDARTVVFRSEKDMKRLLERKPGEAPTRDWGAAWKSVEREFAAVVLDNTRGQWSEQLHARSEPVEPVYHENCRWAVWAINGQDDFVCRAEVECGNARAARELASAALTGLTGAAKQLADPVQDPKDDAEKAGLKFFQDLFDAATLKTDGQRVSIRFSAHADFDALVTALVKGELPL
jgi:hypothetical protein